VTTSGAFVWTADRRTVHWVCSHTSTRRDTGRDILQMHRTGATEIAAVQSVFLIADGTQTHRHLCSA